MGVPLMRPPSAADILTLNNTPTNHVMHHERMRGNYGLYFNIWDRLMGTNHPEYEARFREVTSRPAAAAAGGEGRR